MMKKIVWVAMSCLMLVTLVLASCKSEETPDTSNTNDGNNTPTVTQPDDTDTGDTDTGDTGTEPEDTVDPNMPQYGGELILATIADVNFFDPMDWVGGGITLDLTNQRLWDGDWSKGLAGGYGSGETDWFGSYDVRSHKMGYLAESITFEIDNETNMGHMIIKVRPGIHWYVSPYSEASQLVGGREVTADDIVYSLKRVSTDPQANIYRANPGLRDCLIEKTADDEVTVTVPIENLLEAGKRFGDSTFPVPHEVIEQYGSMKEWENNCGTGPYMLEKYTNGASATLVRNPDYWMTDPVGPGKGNQLPYVDEVRWLIIPDISTRLASFRSGQIDQTYDVAYEDAQQLDTTAKGAMKQQLGNLTVQPIYMRTDLPPFNDIRVRRAMMMATDFVTIEDGLYDGLGNILTWPYDYSKAYSNLYLSLDDADCPASVKELYVYNTDKAKELLAEAGYPDGFETELILLNTEVDYYSIIKDQWSKVGIDINLNVVETGVQTNIKVARSHEAMVTAATGPASVWPMLIVLTGEGWQNASMINDPLINEAAAEIGTMAITDEIGAMKKTRELLKYVLDQAYVIPAASYPTFTYWWPWLKNYSGERSLGYFFVNSWTQFVWVDQDLKESMK